MRFKCLRVSSAVFLMLGICGILCGQGPLPPNPPKAFVEEAKCDAKKGQGTDPKGIPYVYYKVNGSGKISYKGVVGGFTDEAKIEVTIYLRTLAAGPPGVTTYNHSPIKGESAQLPINSPGNPDAELS